MQLGLSLGNFSCWEFCFVRFWNYSRKSFFQDPGWHLVAFFILHHHRRNHHHQWTNCRPGKSFFVANSTFGQDQFALIATHDVKKRNANGTKKNPANIPLNTRIMYDHSAVHSSTTAPSESGQRNLRLIFLIPTNDWPRMRINQV